MKRHSILSGLSGLSGLTMPVSVPMQLAFVPIWLVLFPMLLVPMETRAQVSLSKAPVLLSKSPAPVSYDVAGIPDSLKTNAHAVIRADDETFTVYSPSKAMYKVHEVVTILDEAGKGYLTFGEWSDAFVKLEDADLYLYDAKGQPLQHIRQKEMKMSGYGEDLVTDGKTTYFELNAPSYPITVQIDYTLSYKGLINYPDFGLNNTEHSFQEGQYVLTVPKSIGIRYKNQRVNLKPQITDGLKDEQVYTWKITPIRAQRPEEGLLSGTRTGVMIAPTQFEMDDYAGEMSSWQQFGKWIYDLNKPSYILPETTAQFYRNMVAGASSDLDKARILYSYLQQNFRYVEIQLGIGGWRAFPAPFTDKKKYGDCKGLSTYMKACLDAVGVKSYTALINAGKMEAPVDSTFPENLFNHMILCITQPKDSVWLECTSNRTDFGILSDFTENRNALLMTENGGVLVRTPASKIEENTSFSVTRVNLSGDGSGKADVFLLSTGEYRFGRVSRLYEGTHDDQKKYIVGVMDFQQPDDFNLTLGKIDSPVLAAHLQMSFEKIPEFTAGSKMFLNPRLYHIWQQGLPDTAGRTQDYYFEYPYATSDTTCYELPDGFVVDDLPKGQTLDCPYAAYTSSYRYDQAKKEVISYCTLRLKSRRIPAKDFASVKDFFGQIVADETEKIVIDKP
jgi:hypothetical protein